MLYIKYKSLFILSCLVFFKSTSVNGIDPITGSFVVGAFVAGYFFNKPNVFQYFSSCPKTKIDFIEFQSDMEKQFFGQHIASKIILSSLRGNYHRSSNNKKPLVMSFHGWTGSGKNFISDLIASHMYRSEKLKKLHYHVFHGGSEFPEESKLHEYKEQLHKKIKSTINNCDSNLFVFDELQDVPVGILDVLIPILENNDRSIDSRNSIFIFLTNAGSDSIVEKYISLWNSGYSREQMTIQDFDSVLQKSAFNELGGLKKSRLIDSHVIDHYVPFLPLEKMHVKQCIEAELRHQNKPLDSEAKDDILQIISFGPEPHKLFSTSGCKRIKALITAELNSNLI